MCRAWVWTLGWVVAGLAMGLGEPAGAQQRAGGDGHALDANQRAGSGGRNTAENQIDYRRRNDIITGNVSGGRAFRDQVDYFAPNEFQDELGSDDLFRFRAESLGSVPGGGRAVQQRLGGGQSVYRSFSGLPSTGRAPRSTRIDPRSAGTYDPGAVSQGATPLTDEQFQLGPVEAPAGDTAADPGQPALGVDFSPLLGVRANRPEPARASEPGPDPTQVPEVAPEPVDPDVQPETDAEWNRRTSRLDNRLRPEMPTDGQERFADRPMFEEGLARDWAQQQPTTFLGRELQTRLSETRRSPTIDQRIARMQQSLFDQLQQRRAAENDQPYQNVLEAMKTSPQQRQQAGGAGEDQQLVSQFEADAFELPSDQQIATAEQRRREALDRAFGRAGRGLEDEPDQTDQATDQQGEDALGPDLPELPGQGEGEADADADAQAEGDEAGDALDQTLDQLNYDAGLVESLVGKRETRVDELLAEGEKAIANGQFFDAERIYRQLLSDAPNRPMVRVGLIHSQIGAAMVRSATLNMRRLFNEHPELIATRYDRSLLPPKDRLQWLQKEFQRMIQQNESTFEPALMLAYIGYQVGSRPLVRYGLATAESAAPRDPLLPVLRRIWLDDEAAGRPAGQAGSAGQSEAGQSPTGGGASGANDGGAANGSPQPAK
jgi:hypothetical protein